jgi:hypothetical protein
VLHDLLELNYPYNRKIMEKITKRCSLTQLSYRRIFDGGLKTISIDINEKIAVITHLFVCRTGTQL